MGNRRKDQGTVSKDKLKTKLEPRSTVAPGDDDEPHSPTEVATPCSRRYPDSQDHDMVDPNIASGSGGASTLAVPDACTDTIHYNVPGASPKKKARPLNAVVDLEVEHSTSAMLPAHLSVSEKLDVIFSSMMTRVATLERRDMQVEQQLSVVGGMDMRLKKLESQMEALIDGLPSVRPTAEPRKANNDTKDDEEDPWMRAKKTDERGARSVSPARTPNRVTWGTGAPGMSRPASPPVKPAERTSSAPPSTRQRVPDPKKIFVSGFNKLTHQEVQVLLIQCCNLGIRMQDVTMRTRGLYNSNVGLQFESEEAANKYLKHFRAAKPHANGRPLFASKDTSDENLRASWILRFGRRELIQQGVAATSLRLHIPSKTLYIDRDAVLWVRRQQVYFSGVGTRITDVIRPAWESGG
eukprot:6463007-Amphidinium_carterae.2